MVCMSSRGEIVKQWREAQGLNTRELADAVGTSRQNIENLEANAVDQPRYLPKLARVMGYTSTDELLALREPPSGQGVVAKLAHPMIQLQQIVTPTETTREKVMAEGVPGRAFALEIWDDAASPRAMRGQVC